MNSRREDRSGDLRQAAGPDDRIGSELAVVPRRADPSKEGTQMSHRVLSFIVPLLAIFALGCSQSHEPTRSSPPPRGTSHEEAGRDVETDLTAIGERLRRSFRKDQDQWVNGRATWSVRVGREAVEFVPHHHPPSVSIVVTPS